MVQWKQTLYLSRVFDDFLSGDLGWRPASTSRALTHHDMISAVAFYTCQHYTLTLSDTISAFQQKEYKGAHKTKNTLM